MSTFEAQIAAAEKRHQERAAARAGHLALLRQGEPFKADTPERVHKWFRRRGFSDDLAARAIQRGGVPIEVEGALGMPGRLEPVVLERVLGTSDFLGIAFLERGLQVARTVGRVSVRGRSGRPTGFGTGFMVGPRLLMTNNHVLPDMSTAGDSVVEFDYFVRSDGTPSTVKVFSLQPELFFRTDPELDFSLVAVALTSASGTSLADQGWNPLIPEEGKAIIGQWVNIIQHPNGEPKQLVIRNNEIVDTLDQFLTYRTDTSPGSSGSPVYNDQWEVVALHHAGKPMRDASGAILNVQGQVWQSWMGEHQIRWESNEGARISRIVASVNASNLTASEQALFESTLQPFTLAQRDSEARPQTSGTGAASSPVVDANGIATWTIPLRISLDLGGLGPRGAASPTPGIPASTDSSSVHWLPMDERQVLAAANAELLKHPEVRNVRWGYRFDNGWITRDRALVVTVERKKTRYELQREGQTPLPASFAGYPVQVTGRTLRELVAESAPRTTELERLTDAVASAREIVYVPPAVPLQSFNARMKARLHVSPDAGWPCLSEFLSAARDRLVIGMYDFGAPHILEAILARSTLKELVLVMQRGASLGGGTKKDDLPDEEIARRLDEQFGSRFHFGWVKIGAKNGWVATSYHIKVAVRDTKALWISSGNWQSSNLPNIDLQDLTDLRFLTRHNREWHAVVEHKGLASVFDAYLRHDLAQGSSPDFVEALIELPNLAVPLLEAHPKGLGSGARYFKPLNLDTVVNVTPLLTPDNFFDAAIELVKSARTEILLQNQTFNAPTANQEKLAELVSLLRDKQRRMPVRIIFRRLIEADARRNLEALVDMGFDPEQIRVQSNVHTKGLIVDGKRVLIGSHNLSQSGISVNRDASLLFDHKGIAAYFAAIFEHDWANLALKDVGDGFETPWSTQEIALTTKQVDDWLLLGPKDYLPLL